MSAGVQVHLPRMFWYGFLLGLAALVRGSIALTVLEFVAGMSFVGMVVDLAHRASVFRANRRRALVVAIAMLAGSMACATVCFVLAAQGGAAVHLRNGVWSTLFCGEAVLHYVEHARRCAVALQTRSVR